MITRASTGDDAIDHVEEFLEKYRDKCYDWYAIGGRWSNLLAPMYDECVQKAQKYLDSFKGKPDDQQPTDAQRNLVLQKIWEACHGLGTHPFMEGKHEYNAFKLFGCLNTVSKYVPESSGALGFAMLREAEEFLEKDGHVSHEPDLQTYGYYLQRAGKVFQETFNTEINFYNIDDENYALPEDPLGWYAVVVDLHW
jgi:hypothetical protein